MPVDMYISSGLFTADGQKIMDVGDADFTPKYEVNKPYERKINLSPEENITLLLDSDFDANTIIGADFAKFPDSYSVSFVRMVQARKHRKRRINKKWLKKYGYKRVMLTSDGWKILNNSENGTSTFVKETE